MKFSVFLLAARGQNVDEAELLHCDFQSWDRLTDGASVGEGSYEFEKKRDRESDLKELVELNSRIFYAYGFIYKEERWHDMSCQISWPCGIGPRRRGFRSGTIAILIVLFSLIAINCITFSCLMISKEMPRS